MDSTPSAIVSDIMVLHESPNMLYMLERTHPGTVTRLMLPHAPKA
jgi:hypothetical protein